MDRESENSIAAAIIEKNGMVFTMCPLEMIIFIGDNCEKSVPPLPFYHEHKILNFPHNREFQNLSMITVGALIK